MYQIIIIAKMYEVVHAVNRNTIFCGDSMKAAVAHCRRANIDSRNGVERVPATLKLQA